MLGYSERDIILRCGLKSTPWMVERLSREMGDVGGSCTTITEPRMAMIDYSAPYYHTGYKLLVKRTVYCLNLKCFLIFDLNSISERRFFVH